MTKTTQRPAVKSPRTGRPSKVAPGEECRTVGVWLPVTVIDQLAAIGPSKTEAARAIIMQGVGDLTQNKTGESL